MTAPEPLAAALRRLLHGVVVVDDLAAGPDAGRRPTPS